MKWFTRKQDDLSVKVRAIAARLWAEDGNGGLMRAGVVHAFMVSHPETQAIYEQKARDMMGGELLNSLEACR